MNIDLECEFDPEELEAIAKHRGKTTASEADVRAFVREAIAKAVGEAIVMYRAASNDPSTASGA